MLQPVEKLSSTFENKPNKMRTSALKQLAKRGVVTIQKKGESLLVECVLKDEAGFLKSRQAEWGRELKTVIKDLWEKVRNAE